MSPTNGVALPLSPEQAYGEGRSQGWIEGYERGRLEGLAAASASGQPEPREWTVRYRVEELGPIHAINVPNRSRAHDLARDLPRLGARDVEVLEAA